MNDSVNVDSVNDSVVDSNVDRELAYIERHESLIPLYHKGDARIYRRRLTHSPSRKPTSRPRRTKAPSRVLSPSFSPSSIAAVPSLKPTSSSPSKRPTPRPILRPSTSRPTKRPTTRPTPSRPTTKPTASHRPTLMPSSNSIRIPSFTCDAYTANNTNSGQVNYTTCSYTLSEAQSATVTASVCNAYSGDTFLSAYLNGYAMHSNDDYCGLGSSMTFSIYVGDTVVIYEGCFGSTACSGTVVLTFSDVVSFSKPPTLSPTYLPGHPTPNPSLSTGCYAGPKNGCGGYTSCGYTCVDSNCAYPASMGCLCDCSICATYYPNKRFDVTTATCIDPPTSAPTLSPTYLPGTPTPMPTPSPTLLPTLIHLIPSFTCDAYTVSSTLFGKVNYATCSYTLSEAQSVTVNASVCNAYSGDTILSAHLNGYQVAYNDDYCDLGSSMTFNMYAGNTVIIHEGCFSDTACNGTVVLTFSNVVPFSPSPTASPTLSPTYLRGRPTPNPSHRPTQRPTTSEPTQVQPKYIRIQRTTVGPINLIEVALFYNNTQVPLSG